MSSIQLSAQSSDSLYCSPIWKIRKLTAIAQRVPVLDSLVIAQVAEINRLGDIVTGNEIVIIQRTKMIAAVTDEKDSYKGLYEIQIKLTDQEKKDKRQWKRIAIVIGIIAVVQVFY